MLVLEDREHDHDDGRSVDRQGKYEVDAGQSQDADIAHARHPGLGTVKEAIDIFALFIEPPSHSRCRCAGLVSSSATGGCDEHTIVDSNRQYSGDDVPRVNHYKREYRVGYCR